ncbi:crotonase/enoyl-CoA hydratase family protein [soil metagenome]
MSAQLDERVSVAVIDGVADIRLNRPDKRNALDVAMFRALAAAGERLKTERGVRSVVLSGEGPSFCAGLDFSSFQAMAGGEDRGSSEEEADFGAVGAVADGAITHLGQQVCWVWQQLPVPVIAALHGHAIGGGLQIALAADMRFADPGTKLSVRELHWGLVPDMTGTLTLSGLVRPDVAKELVFSARVLDAPEAARLGLVTRLCDKPRDDAMALAGELAQRNPDALRGAKALLNRASAAMAAEQFEAERRTIGELIGSPNQVEAVMANFEQRPPAFTDPT